MLVEAVDFGSQEVDDGIEGQDEQGGDREAVVSFRRRRSIFFD
jgi:hypothetical protein